MRKRKSASAFFFLYKKMGNLKLGYIKQKKHLKDSINYILNNEKTGNGLFVFGNSGSCAEEVLSSFHSTKSFFGKEDGRQAYHYILTFPPDEEVSPELAREITEEVMQGLFPANQYDWVGAVHNDTAHMHAHIIFNSVDSLTGKKYRYEKGDWEELIQKEVDKICHRNGLTSIAWKFDGTENEPEPIKKDVRYKTNAEKHNSKIARKADLVRQDIDRCIKESSSLEEFFNYLEEDGYRYRIGNSKKYGEYITFYPYGFEKGVRSYTLGKGYGLNEIKKRIAKETVWDEDFIKSSDQNKAERISKVKVITIRRIYVKNLYIAKIWQNRGVFDGSYFYKQAVVRNAQMLDEYRLLRKRNLTCEKDIDDLITRCDENMKKLYIKRKYRNISEDEYSQISKEISAYKKEKTTAENLKKRLQQLKENEVNSEKLQEEKRKREPEKKKEKRHERL